MARSLRIAWLSLRLGVLNALQYRVNFGVQIIQSFIGLVTALAGLAIVFGQTDNLAGWRQEELLALVGVFLLVGGLINVVIRPSMERLMEGVRLGTLDFTLTKPVDSQLLVSVRQVEVWKLVDVGIGAVILVIAVVNLGQRIGVDRAARLRAPRLRRRGHHLQLPPRPLDAGVLARQAREHPGDLRHDVRGRSLAGGDLSALAAGDVDPGRPGCVRHHGAG